MSRLEEIKQMVAAQPSQNTGDMMDYFGWAVGEIERLRAKLALCLGLIRDRSRITYGWDGKNVTMSYFIDGKPYSIFLEDAIAARAAEAEEPSDA